MLWWREVGQLDAVCHDSYAMIRKKCWFVDSKGLLSSARTDTLDEHKKPFAHDLHSLSSGERLDA